MIMKKIFFAILIILAISYSCSKSFLDTKPTGSASFNTLANETGVNAALIGAYHGLLGSGMNISSNDFTSWPWAASPSNWVWGSVASDDATKGSDISDQNTIVPIENYTVDASNGYVSDKWNANYDGISRCNDVLKLIDAAKDLTPEKAALLKGQVLFLRAWFHFELKRVFNKIPFITEKDDAAKVKNDADVWPKIEEDLKFAVANLPETQAEVGRATKYAAKAVLARVYLFEKKYAEAKVQLDDIINSGKYTLMPNFDDNYKISTRNNKESVFEIQYVVNDGAPSSANGSWGDALNFPIDIDGTGTCCGFHQPTQNLVNAFQVDANGLPLFDTFNNANFKNDMGLASIDNFVPDVTTPVDPRLDWTVGRRGVPYLDYGIMRGKDWIRDQNNAGPYLNKKNMFMKSEKGTGSTTTGWATGVNANNYRAYRYAHILLWKAECEIQIGSLETARGLINQVRERASHPAHFVKGRCTTYSLPTGVSPVIDNSLNAANYQIGLYPSTGWTKEYALRAVQWELRLEFAMEGQRFFDLVRWGIVKPVIDAYMAKDVLFRGLLGGVKPAVFTSGKNEYWPIPQSQMELEKGILTQNPGW
jgi:starch-binding outer membrane protein, SusD/RagB family